MDQAEFYKRQISLTEWLEGIKHDRTAAFRKEDFEKYDRLEALYQSIGLPYGRPVKFAAADVLAPSAAVQEYVREHGGDLCMIRVVPRDPANPKLRMRGKSVAEAVEWFKGQQIDPSAYDVYFVPHTADHSWGTIFVVNAHGVFGETIKGEHNKLTQGLYGDHEQPIAFRYDFQTWDFQPRMPEAEQYIKELILKLKISDRKTHSRLQQQLGATFSHDYLCGYFETTSSQSLGTWFLDYNRVLGAMYENFSESAPANVDAALVKGQTGSPGKATGQVRIVAPEQIFEATLKPGEILVCPMTTPEFLPLMQPAAAIVTDRGGVLSHAAIVARELGKPCLTATGNATGILKDGQTVTVDADAGVVRAA